LSSRQNRSFIDIVETILLHLWREGRSKKTHILYASNLNTLVLERYLSGLVEKGFIVRVGSGSEYSLSIRGRILLERIRIVKEMLCGNYNSLELIKDGIPVIEHYLGCRVELLEGREFRGRSGFTYYVNVFQGCSRHYIVEASPGSDLDVLLDSYMRMLRISVDTGLPAILLVEGSKAVGVIRGFSTSVNNADVVVLAV